MTDNRKYNAAHKALRAILLRRLIPGTPCPQVVNGKVCGEPMWPWQPLDLGHNADGTWLGLTHRACNRRAGGINGNRSPLRAGKPDNRRQRPVSNARRW